ncbi:hypothetical protein [Parabacteroides sp. Marseille-P3160]|nr:hypothetical protein [Parabacteroides sp. Marseille-P3160]
MKKIGSTWNLWKVDLKKKQKDFEHLLFNKANSAKILRFEEFVNSLTE